MVKIKVLIDNRPADNALLEHEHGLSFHIEMKQSKVLCDMGASDKFISNAVRMGIDLSEVDFCFVSHGHADHTGGLPVYLKTFSNIKVYLSKYIAAASYFSSRRGARREISTDKSIFRYDGNNRLSLLENSCWLTPEMAAVYTTVHEYSQPVGNCFLTKEMEGKESLDDFNHELSLAIRTARGLVIVSSCSHGGALNIIKSCCEFTGEGRVYAFVGGLHLVDGVHVGQEVEELVDEIKAGYPDVRIYTGHCTGEMAIQELAKQTLNVQIFKTGDCIEFE